MDGTLPVTYIIWWAGRVGEAQHVRHRNGPRSGLRVRLLSCLQLLPGFNFFFKFQQFSLNARPLRLTLTAGSHSASGCLGTCIGFPGVSLEVADTFPFIFTSGVGLV